jgi:hypothetical protein
MRKALVKPEFAELYPEAIPGMWQSAAVLALRVAARLRLASGAELRMPVRTLLGAHFIFRGGRRRRSEWMGRGSRAGDVREPASRRFRVSRYPVVLVSDGARARR